MVKLNKKAKKEIETDFRRNKKIFEVEVREKTLITKKKGFISLNAVEFLV